jgi:hypothetical protein
MMCEAYTFSQPFAFTACTKFYFSTFCQIFLSKYVANVLNYGAKYLANKRANVLGDFIYPTHTLGGARGGAVG